MRRVLGQPIETGMKFCHFIVGATGTFREDDQRIALIQNLCHTGQLPLAWRTARIGSCGDFFIGPGIRPSFVSPYQVSVEDASSNGTATARTPVAPGCHRTAWSLAVGWRCADVRSILIV